MRIAFLSSGSSIHVKKIANAMIQRGHEVTLFTLPNHRKLISDFDPRVKIEYLPVKGKLGYYLNAESVRRRIKTGHYDVINAHYASGYGTLARLAHVHPYVLAVLGSDVFVYPYRSRRNMRLIKKNMAAADQITSTSQTMKEKVLEYFTPAKEITVTPFGVDLSIFHPGHAEPRNVFCFGYIKKIEPIYGLDVLLKAFAKLRAVDEQVELRIYGRGSAEEELKKLSEHLGLKEKVHFHGFIQNELVPEVLCDMDAVCMPSRSESFGVAAVEAMACGVPVIASDANGFSEVIEDGVTGIIVPKDDVDALAAAMTKMMKMPREERIKMGQSGIARVKCLYDFEKNMDTYELSLVNTMKD